jgi:DnaJ family protein C protein 28
MSNVEEHIQRAMGEGKFNDLAGKGKPLKLDANPLEDPDWRMANHILRSNGFTLPWIESSREIDEEINTTRQALARTWAWRQASLSSENLNDEVELEWQRALSRFKEQIEAINQRIHTYNLGVPAQRFQKPTLNADREVTRLTSQALSDKL